MKRRNATRNALLMSVLSMLLCVSMLVGTTFAWFTDSVTSANNIIKSGNLDIELEYWNGTEWVDVEDKSDILTNNLWEPGVTEVAYFRLANVGSLALKYQFGINIQSETPGVNQAGEEFNLSDYIQFGVVENVNGKTDAYDTRDDAIAALTDAKPLNAGYSKANSMLAHAEELYLALVVYMPTTVGNEANHKTSEDAADPDKYRPEINLGINVLATQFEHEEDSFGDDYDANATIVTNAQELADAIAAGGAVTLATDIDLGDTTIDVPTDKATTLNLNGNTISGKSTSNTTSYMIKVAPDAELTLTGNGKVSFYATNPDLEWGGEGQPPYPGYANNTIRCEGKLTIDGATVENLTAPGGASYAIDCYQGSDLIINSGVIDGKGKCAIRMFCNSNTEETNVTVNGGTITGKRAIWVQLPGSNINNVRPVNLTINGGKLICTDTTNDVCVYSYSFGDSFAGTTITITGGEFTGDVVFGGGNAKTTEETVSVTGGTFNGELGRYLANDVWENIAKP